MNNTFDLNKEYGVVLEGGGAKGAYQIGVWKAFLECGVKIKGIAGVSVGALNGALMCMGDYDKAIDIWENIRYSRIIDVDDIEMGKLMNGKIMEISLQEVGKRGKNFLTGGGFDSTPLKNMIDEVVDERKIKESDIEFIMGTFSITDLKEQEIVAKDAEEGLMKDYLLASASFPLFKNEKLHGKKYLDGGVVNNVPIDMLINRGYKDIIVVRIYGIGLEKRVKIPDDINVTYIAPRRNLCNVLEFDKKKAIRGITLGYFDALRVIQSLSGRSYYIKAERMEADYLNLLMHLDAELVRELNLTYRKEYTMNGSLLRSLTEVVFPLIAASLKLPKKWEYSDLYFAILEYSAKKLRIPKLKVYSESQFCSAIDIKIQNKYKDEGIPDILIKVARSLIQKTLA